MPDGVFDGLTSLQYLDLNNNRLTALPARVFDALTSLLDLRLGRNHLVGLTPNDPLFAGLPSGVELRLDGQTGAFVNICGRTPQVRDEILRVLDADDCVAVDSERMASVRSMSIADEGITTLRAGDFAGLTRLQTLRLSDNQLTALPDGVFDGLTSRLHTLHLDGNQLRALPDGVFDGLTNLGVLGLADNQLTALPDGVFDRLTYLLVLSLHNNQLTALPDGVDRMTRLAVLILGHNQLTALPNGLFDNLTSLQQLDLGFNPWTAWPGGWEDLTSLRSLGLAGIGFSAFPAGVFDRLTGLHTLHLHKNQLTAIPAGVFDRLTGLHTLHLHNNQLTAIPAGVYRMSSLRELRLDHNQLAALPDGVFDRLTNLGRLRLDHNRLTSLPDGVFDGLDLQFLTLNNNRLTALPDGVFDRTTGLERLHLHNNQLSALREDVFDGLGRLEQLWLQGNHLVGLTPNDPLFVRLRRGVELRLDGQTEGPEQPETPDQQATRLAAAVPLMISASDSMRQGFVRIINESEESGNVRILAFDDGGTAANPIEIQLGAMEALHFNSNDLENGNAGKGINAGIGSPVQGDWRLDVETALAVRVLAFVRTNDGFLTAMHDVLPRDAQGRLVAHTFNPRQNDQQVSRVRFVNTGANAESVSIEGVDDRGNAGGPVTLTLTAGESRTLSAYDLETGNAQGLAGMLDDGAGKWRLFITAGQPVVGVSLLRAASGHLTNISTMGVATEPQ